MPADTTPRPLRVGLLASHPIQYLSPWARELARLCDLRVYYAHRQSSAEQATAGYDVAFDWDCDLFRGYTHRFLDNVAADPDVSRFDGCDCPEISRVIAEDDLDALLVMGWHLLVYWQALAACRERGVPVLVRGDSQLATPRSRIKQMVKEFGTRLVAAQFDGFLCVGTRNKEYLRHYGVPAERIFLVPHCVDVAFFRERSRLSEAERQSLRRELGIQESEVAALFVGRLVEFKRPVDLVEAVALLRDRLPTRAVFVGAGALETELQARASALCAPISIAGFKNQSELPRIYASADLLVLPSNGDETWGLVVNEAMSCGLPAIVSDAAGCAPDMIEPSRTGFAYPVGDVARLAHAVEDLGRILRETDVKPDLESLMQRHTCERAAVLTLAAVERVIDRKVA